MKSIFYAIRNGKQEKCVPSFGSHDRFDRARVMEEQCKAEFRFELAELPL